MAKKQATDLPFNADAEKAVLGSALISKEALYSILALLQEDDFYVPKNRIIFRAILSLFNKKVAVDALTVTEELLNLKELDGVGGVEYLQQCCDSMVSLASLDFYINIVNDQAVLRKLVNTLRDINDNYINNEIEDINGFIVSAEDKIKTATERRRVVGFKTSNDLSKELAVRINTPVTVGEDDCTGLTTGYASLNRITSGFQPGDMIIVAARPSVGKTALSLNMAFKAALHKNKPVAIFSCEMSSHQLMERLLGIASGVKLNSIKTRRFESDRERAKIASSIRQLSDLPIYIDDTSNIPLVDLLAKSRKLHAEHPDLGLIIIDYLGLISTSGSKNSESRAEEVRKISAALKALAKDLQVPVVAVCQLNRTVEQRGENKRPMLSDLRDSGSIEQDADVVMLMYRDDYYKNQRNDNKLGEKKMNQMNESERFEAYKNVSEANKGQSLPGDVSLVEVNVAKNRNGQVGSATLFFYKAFGRFDQPTQEWLEKIKAINEGRE